MPATTKKVCQRCKKEKPLSEFYHNTTKSDKHKGICKQCQDNVKKSNR